MMQKLSQVNLLEINKKDINKRDIKVEILNGDYIKECLDDTIKSIDEILSI